MRVEPSDRIDICDWTGHEWAPAGGGLEICEICEAERWVDEPDEGKCAHRTHRPRVKASDISDRAMLDAVLAENTERDGWAMIGDLCDRFPRFPAKVVNAKLRQLWKRRLLDGCPCGCRGDWQLTRAGADLAGIDRYYNSWVDHGWVQVECSDQGDSNGE